MAKVVTGTDRRLIEAGFPCHQVGAETQRERGASSALPPLYFLHVWWARRPLTPSRAAILASLLPAGTDPDWFLRQLGIEKVQAMVNGEPWTLDEKMAGRVSFDHEGAEFLVVDDMVLRALENEQARRLSNLKMIATLKEKNPSLAKDYVLNRWEKENRVLVAQSIRIGQRLPVVRSPGDPYWAKQRIEWENASGIRTKEDKYGYPRAYTQAQCVEVPTDQQLTIFDPTAGGGSIPFEALRLGHKVMANDLNPVAAVILYATLDYPLRFGPGLVNDIEHWGRKLRDRLVPKISDLFPESPLPEDEGDILKKRVENCLETDSSSFDKEELDAFLYCRQVTCPHCGGEALLLNTCWLSKEGEKWGVRIVPDGRSRDGTVRFEPYRLIGDRGPQGEDPNFATVEGGVGLCIHCRQAISAEEIKAQARGESPLGRWKDRLYCVVAVRRQPKLDKNGQPQRYKSGAKAGEIKTEKVRFFRAPNERDLEALAEAERMLAEHWPEWEKQGLIPTESIPEGYNTKQPLSFGMTRWSDMFTPRQLLGHLILVEELNRLKPEILRELGKDRGRAVVTYLQFVIDKGLDYNSRQTRWEYTRGIVKGNFGRHDFSPKWTFGEMIFTGPNSGAAWALSQVIDAYAGIAELVKPLHERLGGSPPPVTIRCGTAAHTGLPDSSVDLICMDPPYYNNVQYAELSDFFYVWQRRIFQDLYPELFRRRLTNKIDEAVANPVRAGSVGEADRIYECLAREIFAESRRVLKDEGLMTVMFTHKSQEAWEKLTKSLIENGWEITSSFPVESESAHSLRIMGYAAAASSIFLTCRKRVENQDTPATWLGFGGTGVAQRIREAVREGLEEFSVLRLNPVDEMVACYGRALQVLSENWPVMDGDEPVSPIRAMNEASAVVAQYQVNRMTQGRLKVDDLNPEAAMAVTLYGIFGLAEFPYDEALSLSRSLNIRLESKAAGYRIEGRMIGVNDEQGGRRGRPKAGEEVGYFAPLVRRGSKLRLARPEERSSKRLEEPLTEWDLLHGLIMAYREGDIPVARAYLAGHAGGKAGVVLDLVSVWAAQASEEGPRKEAEAILFGLK